MKKPLFTLIATCTLIIAPTLHAESAFSSPSTQHVRQAGTFVGWADNHSFEVKFPHKTYKVLRTDNHWYKKHLKPGTTYSFVYTKNQDGQYKIVTIKK
ncbi:hypothetical protein A374_09059 [Fictibacillus macauensis ZFHKF-1]|uniref:Uncharacterized protein n=1 Tax=Fictibacillus macauensis ZFHKF-1 TaxID=1196324 RepID=I8UGQ5_9BACL|nr:hypothetical protein [Fictibacillus macauensis]EIT85973.1 hypothetical protein A374_09059 [Fictibacillus macauensis ZFHKF-1]